MKKKYWPLILILIAGTALRFYHNLDISLWHDEAFSALMIRFSWGEMFRRLALDVHPPMYYIFLKIWHYAFGDSLLALRGFSILFGILTIWATWVFVKFSFKSQKMALWAALLVAVNPFQLQYVTEARMYTMGAFFSVLAAYFLVRALREQKQYYDDEKLRMPNLPQDIKLKKSFLWHYLWFAVCAGIMDFTHYYLLFTTAALCLYALIFHIYHYRHQLKRYLSLVTCYLLLIVFFVPWLKQFIFQYKQVQAGYWIPPMDIWSVPGTLWTMLLGIGHDNGNPNTQKELIVVAIFTVFFLWRFLRKTQFFEKWLVILASLAPFGGALLFVMLARLKGSSSSVYEERYFLFCSTFYIIALAAWLSEVKPKWLATSLFGAYCLFNVYAFFNYWNGLDISVRPGMSAAVKFLKANVEPGQHIFGGTSYEFFNLKYYWTQKLNSIPSNSSDVSGGNLPDDGTSYGFLNHVRPLLSTGGRSDVSQISHVEGIALLTNADLVPNFSQAVRTGDTVWVLWTYAFGSNKPELPENWTEVDEKQYPDVRPYVGTSIYVTEYRVN